MPALPRWLLVSQTKSVGRALDLGATAAIDPTIEDLPLAMERIGIGPPDLVFECVGAPGFLQQTIDVMAPRARAVIVGVCMTEDRLMPRSAIRKQATLKFALGYTMDDFDYVNRYLAHNAKKVATLVSKVVPLDGLPEVFEQLRSQKSLIKVLTSPTPQTIAK
jgi:(R,R)-butanediol dehydrogenase / meso-butanediol dehydrogenase / diacetyl reductase